MIKFILPLLFFAFPVIASVTPTVQEYPYVTALNAPPIVFYNTPKWVDCSCVEYAKWRLGKQGEHWGSASQISPDLNGFPEIGSLVLFINHVAVIADLSEIDMVIQEANYIPCQKSTRTIKLNDPTIRGYVNK